MKKLTLFCFISFSLLLLLCTVAQASTPHENDVLDPALIQVVGQRRQLLVQMPTELSTGAEHVTTELAEAAYNNRLILQKAGFDVQMCYLAAQTCILVESVITEDMLLGLAAVKDVHHVTYAQDYFIPQISRTDFASFSNESLANEVQWGIQVTGAEAVWQNYNATGEGVVVATMDTGVDTDHPALVENYIGGFDAYAGSSIPEDTVGHGTHVAGIAVGKEGIGMAPNAKLLAIRVCTYSCPQSAIFAGADWLLQWAAANPNENIIVNNSWGRSVSHGQLPVDMDQMIVSWKAAGILVNFSAGNSGWACNTGGYPAVSAANPVSIGSHSFAGWASDFSSRGPTADERFLPALSAPGEDILSAYLDGTYEYLRGTSMAAPHVTGAQALLWSINPSLSADEVNQQLFASATFVSDTSCGEEGLRNNTYGYGRLNVLKAAETLVDGGKLTGGVYDINHLGLQYAHIYAESQATGFEFHTQTNTDGLFSLSLPEGTYEVAVKRYGYEDATPTTFLVTNGHSIRYPVTLTALPTGNVQGVITANDSEPQPTIATVKIVAGHPLLPPISASTNSTGFYSIGGLTEGTYTLEVENPICSQQQQISVQANHATQLDMHLADKFVYETEETDYTWVGAREDGVEVIANCDDCGATVQLQQPLNFYGALYNDMYIDANGFVMLGNTFSDYVRNYIPTSLPNIYLDGILAPLWHDLDYTVLNGLGGVYVVQDAEGVVVEWYGSDFGSPGEMYNFSLKLTWSGEVTTYYKEQPSQSYSYSMIGMQNSMSNYTMYGYGWSGSLISSSSALLWQQQRVSCLITDQIWLPIVSR